jgi:hypothetical protein
MTNGGLHPLADDYLARLRRAGRRAGKNSPSIGHRGALAPLLLSRPGLSQGVITDTVHGPASLGPYPDSPPKLAAIV